MAIVLLACSDKPAPQHEQAPTQNTRHRPLVAEGSPPRAEDVRMSALLDIQSEKEAVVVAVIGGGAWQAPSVIGRPTIARLARPGASYQVIPAGVVDGAGPTIGALTGNVREDCGDFYLELSAPAKTRGFAVVNTPRTTEGDAAVSLRSEKVGRRDAAAIAATIERAAGIKVNPRIERACRVDLDGNGKPETILQATHADLRGDPAKHKRQHYSVVVVLPDGDGEPAFTGYLQAVTGLSSFQVLTVDSVADVDRDGKRELLLRARHAEGWQTQVFHYDGNALKELFRSTAGEGRCPGAHDE